VIEVIVGVWLTSFFLSMIVVGFNFYFTYQRLQSDQLKILNENLAKTNLFWSNSHGDFSPLTSGAVENDRIKTLRNTALMGLLGLGSLPGFVFLLIIVLSLNILARSRKEVATFDSALAKDRNLERGEVESMLLVLGPDQNIKFDAL